MTTSDPVLEEHGRLRHGDRIVTLSTSEAAAVRLLLARFGRIVSQERLAAALWPREPRALARLRKLVNRVRRRVAPLGLEIRTIRGHGYVLRHAQLALASLHPDAATPPRDLETGDRDG